MCNHAPPPRRDRPPGFRLSVLDVSALILCAPATWGLWLAVGPVALYLPVVLGHFFLFCNVFRIGSRRELAWAGLFLVNACIWAWFEVLDPLAIALTQSPATLGLILWALCERDYHGVGWSLLQKRRARSNKPGNPASDESTLRE